MPKRNLDFYIRKRGTRYAGEVRLGSEGKGSNKNFIRRYATGKTIAEVEKKLTEEKRMYLLGLRREVGKMSVSEFCDHWLETLDTKPQTLIRYRQELKHLKDCLGDILLEDLTVTHVNKLAQYQPVSKANTAAVYKQFKRIVKRATAEGGIVKDIFTLANKPDAPESYEAEALEPEEMKELLEHPLVKEQHMEPMVMFALATGCRVGEIYALRWKNVDLANRKIYIKESTKLVGAQLVVEEPKTSNGDRTIVVSESFAQYLRSHQVRQKELRLRTGSAWIDNGLVFPQASGQYHRQDDRHTKKLKTVFVDLGIFKKNMGWHTLRHTYASVSLRDNINIFVLSKRLGHYDVAFTMQTYGHLMSDSQDDAAQVMDRYIGLASA
jgi:integrase